MMMMMMMMANAVTDLDDEDADDNGHSNMFTLERQSEEGVHRL